MHASVTASLTACAGNAPKANANEVSMVFVRGILVNPMPR